VTTARPRRPRRQWWLPTAAFLALAFVVTWGLWALLAGLPALSLPGGHRLVQGLLFAGGFGPVVAAIVVVWASDRPLRAWARERLTPVRRRRLYAVAVLGPLALHAGTTAVFLALGGVLTVDPNLGALLGWAPVLVVHHSLWAGGNEELGWRGWLQHRLVPRVGLWPAAGAIGVVWALWHVPLFVLPTGLYEKQALGAFALSAVAIGVLLAVLYHASEGSVLPAMVFHGTWNALDPLRPIPVWTLQKTGWTLESQAEVLVLWLAVALVVGVHGRRR
jgi:membrane protease YdiL (CAAX protease family)